MAWSPTDSGTYLPLNNVFANSCFVITTNGTSFDKSTSAQASGVYIPFGDLASYQASNSGDFREFVYSVVDAAYDRIVDINAAITPGGSGDLANLAITRSVNSENLVSETPTITKSFVVTSVLNVTGVSYDVAEE